MREVHAEVRRALGTGDDRLWEGILVTPRVRRIIALAEERAGEREIGPFDLFEALRSEGGSSAAEILRRAGSSKHRLAGGVTQPSWSSFSTPSSR